MPAFLCDQLLLLRHAERSPPLLATAAVCGGRGGAARWVKQSRARDRLCVGAAVRHAYTASFHLAADGAREGRHGYPCVVCGRGVRRVCMHGYYLKRKDLYISIQVY